ncbi:MAG TPA: DUF924 family protein [Caulobacterales bacterium]|nr:DUF924 family protein [Caulobacterales bacterium]
MSETPESIIAFWRAAGPEAWFKKNDAFDAQIRARFEALHHAAARGELGGWEETAEGALALVLLLDQFPRNMYRNSPHAFAADPLARAVAARAIANGFDRAVAPDLRSFFYLPFEHSEDPADQARSVALCAQTGDENLIKWAQIHADIIARFGRFPHRNRALARVATPAEQAFLDAGGFAG